MISYSDTPFFSTTDLLQMSGFLYGKIWLTYYKRLILTWIGFDIL
jgi:hypothetical protein